MPKALETQRTREIHIYLPDEGVDTWRPTQAIELGDGLYKVLPTPDYDPEDEVWEFVPGTIVRLEERILLSGVTPMTSFVAVKA